ncbi:unnamed protein product [Dovyalis caffra]|uniref:AAA+ ATPase domain-containing protein n=1 Tax=Dovyalis caffra TaxID=77055 RepID=A0AAV1RTP2_9ROSI|nr:unnamed protein product [Dovyalis caffra]
MNTAKTYTRLCTLRLFAKPSFSLVSKCSSSISSSLHGLNSLSLQTKHYLQPRSRLNHAVSSTAHRGHLMVQDDLHAFLQILPFDLREVLQDDPKRDQLLEVILDLGRLPEARYLGEYGGKYLRSTEISLKELEYAQNAVGEFGGDNRAGIEGTLHRISAIRSRKGVIVGLTCRVGRAVSGHIDMVHDLLPFGQSILFVGRPGVGKTTVMREIARVLSDEFLKRVVVVDTSNEIGGDGNIPHAAIGNARRMQVPDPSLQHRVMIEAVENHMPEVIVVDEIGTEAEVLACRSIAERGIMLIGTAHGERLKNIIKNPTLSDLLPLSAFLLHMTLHSNEDGNSNGKLFVRVIKIGGLETVTLGDEEARARRSQKSVLERKGAPTFDFLIEMRERHHWVAHRTVSQFKELFLFCSEPIMKPKMEHSRMNYEYISSTLGNKIELCNPQHREVGVPWSITVLEHNGLELEVSELYILYAGVGCLWDGLKLDFSTFSFYAGVGLLTEKSVDMLLRGKSPLVEPSSYEEKLSSWEVQFVFNFETVKYGGSSSLLYEATIKRNAGHLSALLTLISPSFCLQVRSLCAPVDQITSCLTKHGINNFTTFPSTQNDDNSTTYYKLLDFSIQNLRFTEPTIAKPLAIILPESVDEIVQSVMCSREGLLEIRVLVCLRQKLEEYRPHLKGFI